MMAGSEMAMQRDGDCDWNASEVPIIPKSLSSSSIGLLSACWRAEGIALP